jgi:hypothetical protein
MLMLFGGASAWVPPAISGNVLWLRADMGVTLNATRVSGWADQSGTGDANKNVAQGTADNQPLFNASDANLGGRPSLTFAKARSDYLASGVWGTAMPNPATWFIAGRVASRNTNGTALLDGVAGTNRHLTQLDATKAILYSGSVLNSALVSVPSLVVYCSIFGASGKSYINAKTAAASGDTGSQTLTQLRVGAATGGTPAAGYYFDGEIAEVIGYNRALTQGEVETVLAYLGARYAIAIGA